MPAPIALGTASSLFMVIAMPCCSLQPSQKSDLPKVMQIDRGGARKQSWMYEVLMKTFEIRPGARLLMLSPAQDKNPVLLCLGSGLSPNHVDWASLH